MNFAPILNIKRHCINIDGPGITTLVGFYGCPLNCMYCLNPSCHSTYDESYLLTPDELNNRVKIDDVYFKSTNGGITFGGGEPMMFDDFIVGFSRICDKQWNLNIETSLNAPSENLIKLIPIINKWIIDIKDIDSGIYYEYTGRSNQSVITNLEILSSRGLQNNVCIRLPLIKDYNCNKDRKNSLKRLKKMGFSEFDLFDYKPHVDSDTEDLIKL